MVSGDPYAVHKLTVAQSEPFQDFEGRMRYPNLPMTSVGVPDFLMGSGGVPDFSWGSATGDTVFLLRERSHIR